VGFRPFVWQLAGRFRLSGWVLNDAEGVLIEAAGDWLDAFVAALRDEAPPLSQIGTIEVTECDVEAGDVFVVRASGDAGADTQVTPDAAVCADCVAEVEGDSDDDGRRAGYAFTNCTNCGPRFTIVTGLPYDRAQTTMAAFDLCDACRAEYEDPANRRFHAQPVACSACGPKVWIDGVEGDNPIAAAVGVLTSGGVLAIKGLGGFHLACDATDATAVDLLRERKRRPAKPFALMAPLDVVRRHADLSEAEEALLRDPAAPVVVIAKGGEPLPDTVAPGQASLGWMLPYTPLHHMICRAVGRPLVMTSGNLSGEPQVIGNDEAREKLGAFVDAFLMHDRDIARRLDDSVERADPRMVLRRARGRVPSTLPLPEGFPDRQVVAYGGQMKAAICLVKNGQALLGHHLGELDEALTWEAFLAADRDYAELFDHAPDAVAVDLHTGYRATQHGQARAEAEGLRLVGVQHHHAHMAACMAENGWPLDGGKVAGIVLDGTGLGTDGTLWGGEILLGDYRGFERRFWLRPAPLVGGDMAAREPWRNALVRLDQAGLSDWADALFPDKPRDMLRKAAESGMNAPMSSSVGRLFDAVAACVGICPDRQSFEGEAAMRLEALAHYDPRHGFYPSQGAEQEIDPQIIFQTMRGEIANGSPTDQVSSRFHTGLAFAFAVRTVMSLVKTGEAQAIALTGGCFQNAHLLREFQRQLEGCGVPVLTHRTTPANDGGLALGQAAIALAALESD